jgi:hypothetical protein
VAGMLLLGGVLAMLNSADLEAMYRAVGQDQLSAQSSPSGWSPSSGPSPTNDGPASARSDFSVSTSQALWTGSAAWWSMDRPL